MFPDWSASKARQRLNIPENLDIAFMLIAHTLQPTHARLQMLTNPALCRSNFIEITIPKGRPKPKRDFGVRSSKPNKPTVPAGFFSGAHAAVAGSLRMTCDSARYRSNFPKLPLIAPR